MESRWKKCCNFFAGGSGEDSGDEPKTW
jgi:hypothetical protein